MILLDYEDFQSVLPKYLEQLERRKIQKELRLAEVIMYSLIGSKSDTGQAMYHRWKLNKIDELKPKPDWTIWELFNEPQKQKTVWDIINGE